MSFEYKVVLFYVSFLVLLGLGGITSEQIEFPTFPDFDDTPPSTGLSIVGFTFLLIEFISYIFIVIGFFLFLIAFTFTDILPSWISLMLFMPLAMILFYKALIKLVRGGGD